MGNLLLKNLEIGLMIQIIIYLSCQVITEDICSSRRKRMNIDLTAKLKTKEEFLAIYKEGDEKKLYDGLPLIFYALSNNDLESRYFITSFLLDKNVDVLTKTVDDDTVLHILLSQRQHDLQKTFELCKSFLELGVDINALDKKNRLAFQWLINLKYTDEELVPFYDLWFSQNSVDFTTKNSWGVSPMELAVKVGLRATLVDRMKEYEKQH